jgi:hypothetical protein
MYTKSIIQQTVETIRAKENFRSAIEQLLEKYNIEDSVFVLKNGFMHEVVEGYFVTENEYESLDEAMSNCDINTMGIRIIGNIFQTGKLYNRLSECADSNKKVFDLKRLGDVR